MDISRRQVLGASAAGAGALAFGGHRVLSRRSGRPPTPPPVTWPTGDAPDWAGGVFSDLALNDDGAAAWADHLARLRDRYEGEKLNVIWWNGDQVGYRAIAPFFEELTGARVHTVFEPYDTQYLRQTFIGNNGLEGWDVIIFDMPWVGLWGTQGYCDSLNDRIDEDTDLIGWDDFYKPMADGTIWDGDITGLPFAPYFVVNAYNTALLDAAGVQPPRTYPELVTMAAAVTDNVPGNYGVAMNNQTGTVAGQAFFEYIYNMGGRPFTSEHPDKGGTGGYYEDMTPHFSSPEGVAVVELFRDLLPYQPPGKLDFTWMERLEAFRSGQAATFSSWNFQVPPLAEADSPVRDNFVVQPALTAPGVPLNTPVGGWEMGVNRHTPNKQMAWDYISWFTSVPMVANFVAHGGFPSRYSALNQPDLIAANPYFEVIADVVDTSFPAFRPQVPESFDIIRSLGTWIAKVLYGELDVPDAMARADAEIGSMLAEAGYKVDR